MLAAQVVRTILGYGTVCFLYNLLDELVPIFAAAPISTGGLDLSAAELSGPLSTSGIFLMVLFPHYSRMHHREWFRSCFFGVCCTTAALSICYIFFVHGLALHCYPRPCTAIFARHQQVICMLMLPFTATFARHQQLMCMLYV